MIRFLTVITLVVTSILFTVIFYCSEDQNKISQLEVKVDSLYNECAIKDAQVQEATSTAIQLSDRLNELYDNHPDVHREIFSK